MPVGWKLFLTAWIVFSAHFATDIVREHYPAFSLAERGTLRVDPYLGLHPDLFAIEGRGAFINNNPGASIVGAVPYAVFRPLVDAVVERVAAGRSARAPLQIDYDDPRPLRREFFRKVRERGLDVRFGLAAAVIQAFGFAPLAAAAVVLMYGLLLRLGFEGRASVALALLYAFGTPLFFRTGFLNHNLLVAHATLACFALLHGRDTAAPERRTLWLAGFVIGFGLLCDYAGAVPVLVMGCYALFKLARVLPAPQATLRMLWMVGGACLPVGALLAYQAWAFGNLFFPAQHYMPDTHLSVHGWNGFSWPTPRLLLENCFDPRYGLFSFGPILALAFAAPWLARGAAQRVRGAERVLAFGFFAALLIFTSANQFSSLQWNTGFRMLAPVVPLLFPLAAEVLVRLPRRLAWSLGGAAVLHSWCIAMVRSDALGSVQVVLGSGPRLPWLVSLWRAGGSYLPPLEHPTLVVCVLLAVLAALVAAIWSRSGPRGRGGRAPASTG